VNLSESLGKMGMSKSEKLAYIAALRERLIRQSRGSLLTFTTATMPTFEPAPFHIRYYNVLNKFADGKIKKLMVFMPPQHGKLLPANTPVLTTKGWKNHGDLVSGDYVFGQDGKPKRVIQNFGVYDWNVERITFNDGNTMLAAKEHLWRLQVEYDDHKGRREVTIETQQIFAKKNRRAPFIDIAPALEMPKTDLPIDPYVLGCWLGDGTARQGVLTVGKQDIEHFAKLGESREVKPGIYRVLVPGLSKLLRENGLILNKHIPMQYLLASKEQRYELLRGLMDTDGCVDKRGNCEFTQKDNGLVKDVYTLIRTLGIKARINHYDARLNGRLVGIKVRINFNPDRTDPVFSLERKLNRLTNKSKGDRDDKKKYFIKEIKPFGPVKGNCIEVEGSMYLAGLDLIPTHNSEGSTRRLPAFVLGKNPDKKVAVISYSAPKARKFNREIQRIIDTEEYAEIFPSTKLNASDITTVAGAWLRNADECEIVGHRGGFKTVGVGGPLTGEPVDMLIMDDIYKDAKTAWSPTVRESIEDWYDTVAETRLHNDSQQLIVFTRWHENDLAGRLLEQQGIYDPVTNPNGWVVVTYQAIKVGKPTAYDPREEGEPLWPERHNLEKLKAVRNRNSHVFESLYQQDPKPLQGLMYEQGFREYDVIPYSAKMVRKNYTDTADTGDDYLCSICYTETEDANYVTDILYTQKPMEYTETKTAEMLTKHQTQVCIIESNNGGRGFARNVEKQVRALNNTKTRFKWFHQKDNKVVRIFSKSADVQNMVYFPRGWDKMWPDFYQAVTTYMKVGKNDHDDAPDALTGTVEWRGKAVSRAKDLSGVF